MSIIRIQHNKENPFVMLNKAPLELQKMTWEAKGLWAYLISRPDNWEISVKHLSHNFPSGRDKVRKILNELIELGLCSREEKRNTKGRIEAIAYIIYEEPLIKKCLPETEIPGLDSPGPVNPNQIKKEYKQGKKEKKKEGTANAPPQIFKFGKKIQMKLEAYEELVSSHGEEKIKDYLTQMDDYLAAHGKVYKDYAAALRQWIRRDKGNSGVKDESNQEYAKKIAENFNLNIGPRKKVELKASDTALEIYSTHTYSRYVPQVIKYSVGGFKDQVEGALRKFGLI